MGERVAALGVKILMVGQNDILEAQVLLAMSWGSSGF